TKIPAKEFTGPFKRLVLNVSTIVAIHTPVKIKRRYLLGSVNSSPLFLMMGLIYVSSSIP
ncbi:MAG: hypothetical protein K6C96_03680, partial [Butyrivibrio sp.]|nr:hypothetical protein [Butyrivibrio sp.]